MSDAGSFWWGVWTVVFFGGLVWATLCATRAMKYRDEMRAAIEEHRILLAAALELIKKAQEGQKLTDDNLVPFKRRDT